MPVIVTAPKIRQYAAKGSPLVFVRGTYTGNITSYTQQWMDNGTPIVGATGVSFTPSGSNTGPFSVAEIALDGVTPSSVNTSLTTPFATTGSFLGDSITFGQGASVTANRWTSSVSTNLGLVELNQGVSGTIIQNSIYDTSVGNPQGSNGRDRFAPALLGANARMRVYIAYTFNDTRLVGGTGPTSQGTGCTRALTISNYKEVLNGLICSGIRHGDIVLVAPYWLSDTGLNSGTTGFNMVTNLGSVAAARAQLVQSVADVLAIATEYGCPYVDGYAALMAVGSSGVGADFIHPNDSGYAGLTTAILAPSILNTNPVPTGVTAVKSGTGQMQVTWVPPSTVGTGLTVTNYTVEYGRKSDTVVATAFKMIGTTNTSSLSLTFNGLADYWYVARVRANFSDSTSSPWAWFTAGVAIDSRNIDTTTLSTDFTQATVGVTVESISPWTKLATSSGSELIAGSGTGTRGFDAPAVSNGQVATQTYLYKAGSIALPATGTLFGEQVWSYLSSASGNANTSIQLQGNSASTPNGTILLFNDSSFRVFKLAGGSPVLATSATTGTVTLTVGLDYLVRFEVSNGVQKGYLNNALICTAAEPTGGTWGTEVGWRLANTSYTASDVKGTQIKSARYGTASIVLNASESGSALEATDSASGGNTYTLAQVETRSAIEVPAGQGIITAAYVDALSALEVLVQQGGSFVGSTETLAASDVQDRQYIAGVLLAEALAATDSQGVSLQGLLHAVESGTAVDIDNLAGIIATGLAEIAPATDVAAQLGAITAYNQEIANAIDTGNWLQVSYTLIRLFTFTS